jgi:hypothetical protein
MDNDTEVALATYRIISEQIIKEDNIKHQRITSGFTVNGALITLVAIMYGAAKDNLREPKDILFAGCALGLLALIAIWVCYMTIQGIVLARRQISYIQGVYRVHWKATLEDGLKLPRPWGSWRYDEHVDGKKIKISHSEAEKIFKAIILLWVSILLFTGYIIIKTLP